MRQRLAGWQAGRPRRRVQASRRTRHHGGGGDTAREAHTGSTGDQAGDHRDRPPGGRAQPARTHRPHRAPDELRQLADTFDDTAFGAQRRFVANASHELRTPLTINRTLIEVALSHPDPPAQLRGLGETLLSVNARHEKLIEDCWCSPAPNSNSPPASPSTSPR